MCAPLHSAAVHIGYLTFFFLSLYMCTHTSSRCNIIIRRALLYTYRRHTRTDVEIGGFTRYYIISVGTTSAPRVSRAPVAGCSLASAATAICQCRGNHLHARITSIIMYHYHNHYGHCCCRVCYRVSPRLYYCGRCDLLYYILGTRCT